jgi:hypothetical protein
VNFFVLFNNHVRKAVKNVLGMLGLHVVHTVSVFCSIRHKSGVCEILLMPMVPKLAHQIVLIPSLADLLLDPVQLLALLQLLKPVVVELLVQLDLLYLLQKEVSKKLAMVGKRGKTRQR